MLALIHQQGALAFAGFFFVSGLVFWALFRLQRSLPSPVNKLIVRWIRLIAVGLFLGLLFKVTFFNGVPLWRLYIMGVLLWLLVESGYLWLYILAWDKSELPLFPTIREVERVEWPANLRFFAIKDWIREHCFNELGCVQYRFEDDVIQQVMVFQSPDATIRLQVVIVNDVSGVILDQVVFHSESEDGSLWITDNVFMPFGGVYPKSWRVERYPSMRKIGKVASLHQNRLVRANSGCWVAFESSVGEWMDDMQRTLELENIEAGILNHRCDRNSYGKMTGEGRYRIWKELLLLNYLSVCPGNWR